MSVVHLEKLVMIVIDSGDGLLVPQVVDMTYVCQMEG